MSRDHSDDRYDGRDRRDDGDDRPRRRLRDQDRDDWDDDRDRPVRRRFVRDPAGLTAFVQVMLGLSILTHLLSAGSDWLEIELLSRQEITEAEAEANDLRQGVVGLVVFGVYLVTAVAVLKWVYRANRNARGFGADDLSASPGWAVGYFFVPILNLFRPYQAMREVWQASRNPADWRGQPGSPRLGLWWALWVVSNLAGQVQFRLALRAKTQDELAAQARLSLGVGLLDIALCLSLMAVVAGLYRLQVAWVRGDDIPDPHDPIR
ncbi:MAG: DUF4328 domain-containing protein [Gemmataceae bacterium]|nr:DUF4328 domain-containing protein [Gemmataceae bacterium]